MLNRIKNFLHSLIPHIEQENIFLETETILEIIFFGIFDIFSKMTNVKIERHRKPTAINFVRDLFFIFLFLEMITQIILLLPFFIAPDDPSVGMFSIQVLVITLFCSITWTGFVYLIENVRDLVRLKIIPTLEKNKYPHDSGFYDLIRQFFNGTNLKWRSGSGFRFHWRSVIFLMFLIPFLIISSKVFTPPFFTLVQTPSVMIFLIFVLMMFMVILMSFFLLIISYILLTTFAIFFYLFVVALGLKIEINPLFDMGGTQKYGEIIVRCIFLVSFGLASLPVFLVLAKIQSIPKTQLTQISNQTIGNISTIIKNDVVKSINEVSINSISQYYSIFFMFFFFVISAIVIILLLHYRIKQRKSDELHRVETILQDIDFFRNDDQAILERNQYFLSLHEKISTSYEWPIKKIFIVELILAGIPLIISYLL